MPINPLDTLMPQLLGPNGPLAGLTPGAAKGGNPADIINQPSFQAMMTQALSVGMGSGEKGDGEDSIDSSYPAKDPISQLLPLTLAMGLMKAAPAQDGSSGQQNSNMKGVG